MWSLAVIQFIWTARTVNLVIQAPLFFIACATWIGLPGCEKQGNELDYCHISIALCAVEPGPLETKVFFTTKSPIRNNCALWGWISLPLYAKVWLINLARQYLFLIWLSLGIFPQGGPRTKPLKANRPNPNQNLFSLPESPPIDVPIAMVQRILNICIWQLKDAVHHHLSNLLGIQITWIVKMQFLKGWVRVGPVYPAPGWPPGCWSIRAWWRSETVAFSSKVLPTHANLCGPSALWAPFSSQPDSIVSKQMQVERHSLDREQTTPHEIKTES